MKYVPHRKAPLLQCIHDDIKSCRITGLTNQDKSSTITQLLEGPEWGREEKGDFDQGKDLLSNLCAGHLPAKRPCEWDWDTLQQRPRQRPRLDYAAPIGISHVYHVSTSISQLTLYCTDRCMVCSQARSKKPGHIQT